MLPNSLLQTTDENLWSIGTYLLFQFHTQQLFNSELENLDEISHFEGQDSVHVYHKNKNEKYGNKTEQKQFGLDLLIFLLKNDFSIANILAQV